MEFHPEKCQILRITKKQSPILATYNIHNVSLSPVDSAKYLGVNIDCKLNWTTHCKAVCNKASSTLAFLERNLRGCPSCVKEKCYKTFVLPTLEYGCSVWDPHHSSSIDNLEKIHKRAARFVTGNYALIEGNTKKNMTSLNWPPLTERRARIKLTTLYKARSGAIEIPMDDLIPANHNTNIVTRTNTHRIFIPDSRVDTHLYSFFPDTIRLWNQLPQQAKSCDTIAGFKQALENHTLRASYNN